MEGHKRIKSFFGLTMLIPALSILVLAVSCGAARRMEPIGKPMNYVSESISNGELLYKKYCHKCHPNGETGLGPSLNDKKFLPSFMIKMQVRAGLGAMPSFAESVISSEQLDDIVDFIKEMRNN